MARKIKNTGNNAPEIIFPLAPPLHKQGKDYEELRNSSSKNNKLHKKRKNKYEHTKKNNLPEIIITSVSDDEDEEEKVLTVSNSNDSNAKLPKIIINVEDNEIISTNHEFVDFDYNFDENTNKANQNISNESFNNNSKQQKEERNDKNLFQNKENIINKNILSNVPSNKIPKIQLLKLLKKKILG